jgi:hypothetical protein
MAGTSSPDYVYIVEWDDSVHRPPFTVVHGITLNQGVSRADFEKFVAEEAFARVGDVRTKAGTVAAQYLVADTTGDPPLRLEDLDFDVDRFGKRMTVSKYRVIASWARAAQTPA